jgi:vitamin B12 transporter
MKTLSLAGLAGLATLGAHAQGTSLAIQPFVQASVDPVVVTATRAITPASTLREAIVITRDDLESAGPLSLAELLQRRAGIEFRATGGAGQPQTLFIRGAGTAQTLVLVDGLRVGSATVGTTSIEHIPLEMIERIEIVKGPMSSLYGPEAIGGVIQIFTRGRSTPHLFVSSAYGTDNDSRLAAGIATQDNGWRLAFSMGARHVDAPSATNPRATFSFNPDRDPYANAFANLRASQTMWQGETVELEAFTSRSRTHFDSGPASDDRNDQTISGVRLTSSASFAPWWMSRLAIGEGRDKLVTRGSFAGLLETRQDQASWINEVNVPGGKALVGLETLRQKVVSDTVFTRTRRDTNSAFLGLTESYGGQHVEGSARRDDDDQFGARNTGSLSYGLDFPALARLSATYARGFRAPTFFDLYGPTFPGYTPNAALEPEHSKSYEIALRSDAAATVQWRVTAFHHRFENLIVYSPLQATVLNVARARSRGVEASVEGAWLGTRLRATLTAQRPRDEDTGFTLQGRAERYGSVDASRSFGPWTAGVTVTASGQRFDSTNEAAATRLGGYALLDARVSYRFARFWRAELAATNLADRRYEGAVGYDAPRRAVMLSVRFDAF